jgi:aryl-phospho-beta-D-glucosidase BglC (GH1 family)
VYLAGPFGTSPVAAATPSRGYVTHGGQIQDESGTVLNLRGISHFGFNALILQPEYLWQMGWKEQIAQIKALGFNAVRVPFVPDTLYNTTPVDRLSFVEPHANPELIGKTPQEVLDLWMVEADRQGLYILLDFHSVSMQRQYPTWFVSDPADFHLIYNHAAYSADDWVRDLVFVAKRYAALKHFLGIDLYNEPNSSVRWSSGDRNFTDAQRFWKPAAEKAANAVLAANPRLLVFVEGINGDFDGIENSRLPMNWGEDLQPEAYQPLAIPADKLVLSPHTYGPDVYMKSSFGASDYPANLGAGWDVLFGQFARDHPVVIGEWGGQYGQGPSGARDVLWQDAFVDYLILRHAAGSFYWCYTPNSGDSGGILDAQLRVRADKMALLHRLWDASREEPMMGRGGAAPGMPPMMQEMSPSSLPAMTPSMTPTMPQSMAPSSEPPQISR